MSSQSHRTGIKRVNPRSPRVQILADEQSRVRWRKHPTHPLRATSNFGHVCLFYDQTHRDRFVREARAIRLAGVED